MPVIKNHTADVDLDPHFLVNSKDQNEIPALLCVEVCSVDNVAAGAAVGHGRGHVLKSLRVVVDVLACKVVESMVVETLQRHPHHRQVCESALALPPASTERLLNYWLKLQELLH